VRTSPAAVALALAVACSSGRDEGGDRPTRDRAARDGGTGADGAAGGGGRPLRDGGASAATTWTGTFRGGTEVPDGGLPDGGTAWSGEGTARLHASGEEVSGRLEGQGMTLEVRGNLASRVLRAWLHAPAGQPRTEGVLFGDLEGGRLTGTWRTSGPGGVEVRAGTFEAQR
jgi:hypothetical protein